jgi:hypothetical protein
LTWSAETVYVSSEDREYNYKECGGNLYLSMAGGRNTYEGVEAAVYVSMAEAEPKKECWRQQSM